MTAGYFIDDPIGRVALALLCYVGILLYATTAATRGVRQAIQEMVVNVVFLSLLPIPSAPRVVYTTQFVLFFVAIGLMGVLQVRFALLRHRAVRAYSTGTEPRPIVLPDWILIATPAVLVSLYPIISAVGALIRSGAWRAPMTTAELSGALGTGLMYVFLAVAVYGGYMAVAWVLDQTWLRSVGRIRLLSADARFVWINLSMGVICVLGVALMVVFGGTGAVTRYALIALLVLSLGPAINGLSWVYDAVFRRLVILHVLLAMGALLALGLQAMAAGFGVPSSGAWALALAVAIIVAALLPARLDALLDRFFFPRSGRMRARLLEIATEPLRAVNRADAGGDLLRRLVEVLDSEGGIFVADAAATEPTIIHAVGRVDASVLGASALDVAGYVATLPLQRGPCAIESLPLAQQLRLLEAGIVFVCPLRGRHTDTTLLLGPRRGWMYDVATADALRVFASQAGLALENLALVGARAHAEKLAALGEAAARIAHEIRNPLSAARSLVQLAGDSDCVGELTTPAITELDRIGQLVTDLLAFARRDESLNRVAVDLSAVCHSALTQVGPLARDAGVEVQTSIDAATVDGDANRLVQVVANLCRNAIEALATSPTTRRLDLRCSAVNGSACIEVRDSGPGIPAADISRIFEPFATTKSAGTGLGLPIARRIVEAHGGALVVESRPGAETIFRVALPLAIRS